MDLYSLQQKIKLGYELTAAEKAFMVKYGDSEGRPSRRQFIGLAEYPDSVIDFED